MDIDIITYLEAMLDYYKQVYGIANINVGMLRGLGKTETLKKRLAWTLDEYPNKRIGILVKSSSMIPQYKEFEKRGLKIITVTQGDLTEQINFCDYLYSDEVYNAEQIIKRAIGLSYSSPTVYLGGFFSSELRPCDVTLFKNTSEGFAENLSKIKKAVVDLLTGAKSDVSVVLDMLEKLPE